MEARLKLSNRARFGKSESTLPEQHPSVTPKQPPTLRAGRHGTVCVWGYGVKVFVRDGHLRLLDGVGRDRHEWRFAKVGSSLKRLVILTDSGFITFDALRWIFDRGAAFVMLRGGSLIASTGPAYGLDDARLRRAQALARQTAVGVEIARGLIDKKLFGQERLARDGLRNSRTADLISRFRKALVTAKSIEAIALLESQAAAQYWKAWKACRSLSLDAISGAFPTTGFRWAAANRRYQAHSALQRPLSMQHLTFCMAYWKRRLG